MKTTYDLCLEMDKIKRELDRANDKINEYKSALMVNPERMAALCYLVKLVDAGKELGIMEPFWCDAEREATYFLQARKLSPYREDHQENIKELFEAVKDDA